MPLLLALFLLIFHSIVPAPSAQVAVDGARARWASADRAAASELHGAEHVHGAQSVSLESVPGELLAWVREARSLNGSLATRGHVQVRTPPADAATNRLSIEAAFASSVRVRTLDDSHAVSGRGALLPYYPTAPPLRG